MSRSEAKEPSFEMYIGDLLEFMRYCKIWKPDTFSAKKNLAVTLIVGILLSSDTMLIVTAIMDFKNASANLTSLAAYLGPLCLQTIGLIKWSYSIWKVKDIARLVETLENCHYLCMKINKNDIGKSVGDYSHNVDLFCFIQHQRASLNIRTRRLAQIQSQNVDDSKKLSNFSLRMAVAVSLRYIALVRESTYPRIT